MRTDAAARGGPDGDVTDLAAVSTAAAQRNGNARVPWS
jgi:hypothetical protein